MRRGAAPYAVVAGGGTGGHVLQALALAKAIEARGHPADRIELLGSRRGQEASLLAGEPFPVVLLPGRGIARRFDRDALVANVGAVAGLAWATVRTLVRLARRRPEVVVSVGGYAAFPADLAAVVLRIPLVLVNVDAVPGLVHRAVGRWAAACTVPFPTAALPRAVVTGTAVRREIVAVDRSAAMAARGELGLPTGRRVVAVVGGSLGARRLNDAALGLARRWAGRTDVVLYHVTGRRDWEAVRADAPVADVYRAVPFERRMDLLYASADVVVSRAGALTVAELAVAGVPSVLVPLPGAPGDHQGANARALVDAGAAVLLVDGDCEGERLAEVVDDLLADPGRLGAMGKAAGALGRPDAAERVAALVDSVAGRTDADEAAPAPVVTRR